MRIDRAKLARRRRRYWAIVVQIGLYFGVHTLILTALPLSIDDPTVRLLSIAIYMGAGILFDTSASAAAVTFGIRRVSLLSGVLLTALALVALTGVHLGWIWVPIAFLLAVCSSLLYIPGLAYYSKLLGPRQADGQRIAVVIQRGGALLASVAISAAMGGAGNQLLWGLIFAAGIVFALLSRRFRRVRKSESAALLNPFTAIRASVSSAVHSRTLLLGLIPTMMMPLIFVLDGSILPVQKADLGASVGAGLLVREALSIVTAVFIATGSRWRANVEFIALAVLAGAGSVIASLGGSTELFVILGIASAGPLVAASIVVSVLNVSTSASRTFRPWAHFGAMGMSARLSGLTVPFLLSAGPTAVHLPLATVVGILFAVAIMVMTALLVTARRADGDAIH